MSVLPLPARPVPHSSLPVAPDTASDCLAGLTPSQREAALAEGAVLVLAGAGTGKTKTLTAAIARRILSRSVRPDRVLAVTFTNKAAAEMSERIRSSLGLADAPSWLGTFHGLGARQLRLHPEIAWLRRDFDIIDAEDTRRMIRRILKARHHVAGSEAETDREMLSAICVRISKLKDDLVTPAEAPVRIDAMLAEARQRGDMMDEPSWRALPPVYAEYQRRLVEANAADFGDLLLWPTRALINDPVFRERWSGRFDAIFADEYQDVNRVQHLWLGALASRHGRIFVVGDDDQCIYGWRGSDLGYIRRFQKDYPGARLIRLEENFRSTGHILDAANHVIAVDRQRIGKTLFTRKQEGDLVEIAGFPDADAEAQGIAGAIQRHRAEGAGWEDFAVLYRGNVLSRRIEEAMIHARIPYVLVGDVGFYQRAEIKDALALLRVSTFPDDRQSDEALRRVINTPPRGFGAKAMDALEAEASRREFSLFRALETVTLPPRTRIAGKWFVECVTKARMSPAQTLADRLSLLLELTGYRAMLRASEAEDGEARFANLQELLALAATFHTARDLLDHASLASGRPSETDQGRVRLMTMHKAKGLEFPHVFLAGFEDGIFPSQYADANEERRLAYVAITRGMRRVTITHAASRRGLMLPSPFLADIPDHARRLGWLHEAGRGIAHWYQRV